MDYTMSERNTPISTAGATTPKALSDSCRPVTDKWLRIIRNQAHRRRRQRVNPTCNSRVPPRIAISKVSVECGVERGRAPSGARPFRFCKGRLAAFQGTRTGRLAARQSLALPMRLHQFTGVFLKLGESLASRSGNKIVGRPSWPPPQEKGGEESPPYNLPLPPQSY